MDPSVEPIEPRTAGAAAERQRLVVWRYLRALGASTDEADDLCQEAFAVALATGRRPDNDAGPFLRGVARNLWLRSRRWWRRRREREIAAAVDELWLATAEHDGGDELVAALRGCLDALQSKTRHALELHYHDGVAWPEVGVRLGLAPNGVKTLAQRARAALRTCLERRGQR